MNLIHCRVSVCTGRRQVNRKLYVVLPLRLNLALNFPIRMDTHTAGSGLACPLTMPSQTRCTHTLGVPLNCIKLRRLSYRTGSLGLETWVETTTFNPWNLKLLQGYPKVGTIFKLQIKQHEIRYPYMQYTQYEISEWKYRRQVSIGRSVIRTLKSATFVSFHLWWRQFLIFFLVEWLV